MSTTGSTQRKASAAPLPLQVVSLVIVKSLKVILPELFDSSWRKLWVLFSQIELFFRFNADRFINKKYKVLFANSYLKKPAFEWLNTFLQNFWNNDPKDKNDVMNVIIQKFSRFQELMAQVFRAFNKEYTAEQEMQVLRQTDSAAEYTSKFQQYAM